MRRAKRTIVILSLALAGCHNPVTFPATVTPHIVPVRILATTATYPLLQELIAGYHVPETLLAVNSTVANWETIQTRLLANEVAYALTTYVPSEAGFWVAPLGWDSIAVIVHPANAISALGLDDLRRLIQGRITNWAVLGGADLPVTVVSRETGAATWLALDALVMGGRRPAGGARLALSSERLVEFVANTPGAMGYVSRGALSAAPDQDAVQIAALIPETGKAAVFPEPAEVSAGAYPLRTPVLVVGTMPPEPGSGYYEWFAWMQSDDGQEIVGRRYIPLAR
jgi:phosphate transport system substrate-binding protein